MNLNFICCLLATCCCGCGWVLQTVVAQPSLPNRSIVVSATQPLSFGPMTVLSGSSGGTVILEHDGTRVSTGEVVLLNSGDLSHQAIFELKLCPGRSVMVNYTPTIQLIGSNGGYLTMDIGPTNLGSNGSVFTSNLGCDDTHLINVGGTLHVGSIYANPPGTYSGSFSIVFVQQ